MSEPHTDLRHLIERALNQLSSQPLHSACIGLLATLGYQSHKTVDLGSTANDFISNIEAFRTEPQVISRKKLHADHWLRCTFLFQLTNDEIPSLVAGQAPLDMGDTLIGSQIESLVFLAIDLQGSQWSRRQLTAITRELNRNFPMPTIVLFRHEGLLSIAVIDRRQNLRDPNRDVIDNRITVIKDVRLAHPHRAHLEILASIALQNLGGKHRPGNFRELYDGWMAALSTEKLNQDFYRKLAWWYLWACKEVEFPKGGGGKRNEIGVIRLLTRLIFVWFIKERGLIPEALFEPEALSHLLKQAPVAAPDESNYYRAILQNLFFATLNQELGEKRRWAQSGKNQKSDYLDSRAYRYGSAFKNPDLVLQNLFGSIPFLNGGLFECLDEPLKSYSQIWCMRYATLIRQQAPAVPFAPLVLLAHRP